MIARDLWVAALWTRQCLLPEYSCTVTWMGNCDSSQALSSVFAYPEARARLQITGYGYRLQSSPDMSEPSLQDQLIRIMFHTVMGDVIMA